MGWYRHREARKAKVSEDRPYGRHAQPPRRFRGGSGGGGGNDWGDAIGDAVGSLVEALFKIFD